MDLTKYTLRLQNLDFDNEAWARLQSYTPQDRHVASLHEELKKHRNDLAWVLTLTENPEKTLAPNLDSLRALYALKTGLWPLVDISNWYNGYAGTFMWHEPKPLGGTGIYVPTSIKFWRKKQEIEVRTLVGGQLFTLGEWPVMDVRDAEAFMAAYKLNPATQKIGEPAPEVIYETAKARLNKEMRALADAPGVSATLHNKNPGQRKEPGLDSLQVEYDQTLLTRTGTFHPGPKYYTFSTDRALSQGKTQDLVLKDGLVTLPRKDGSYITYQVLN